MADISPPSTPKTITHNSVSQADGKADTLLVLPSGAQCNRATAVIHTSNARLTMVTTITRKSGCEASGSGPGRRSLVPLAVSRIVGVLE
jgi:hypothetical protein